MFAIYAVNRTALVLFIVFGVIAIIALAFLLNYFVISRSRIKKQMENLQKKFSYLDSLLIGQDSQYISRLELISRTNLLYLDKYDFFSRRFKEVYESDDKYAESMLKQLKALIDNKQYNSIKTVLADTKKAILSFEEKVNALDKDLYSVIKPEQESRQTIQHLKETYRTVKTSYYGVSSDLELVAPTFNIVFNKLDQNFVNFENHIESAEYEEANAIIPVVDNVIRALEKAITTLPNLCILTTTIIPNKISELKEEYYAIERRGMPLFNLSFKTRVEDWNNALEEIKEKLCKLQTSGVLDALNEIQNEIENVRGQLNDELEDKDFFEKNMNEIYAKVIEVEKSFLKICSILPEVDKLYIVDDAHKEQIASLRKTIDSLGTSKRTLDNFIHSATKQPYSLLKNKLDELRNDYEIAYSGVNDFKAFLISLNQSSKDAYNLVFVYYYRLKQIESVLRDIAIDEFSNKYQFDINQCYDLLNEIDKGVKQKPIDIAKVNEDVENLKRIANDLFDDVDNKYREEQLAESAVVYANRDRKHQTDVNQQLSMMEAQFFKGDFGRVYHEANALYQRIHVEDGSNNG